MDGKIISFYIDVIYNLLAYFTYMKYCNFYMMGNGKKPTYFRNYCLMIVFHFITSYGTIPLLWLLTIIVELLFNQLSYYISYKKNLIHVLRFNVIFYLSIVLGHTLGIFIFDNSVLLNNGFYQNLKGIIICTVVYILLSLIFSNKSAQKTPLHNPYKKYVYFILCLIVFILCALVIYNINFNVSKETLEFVVLITFMINIVMIILIITIYERIVDFLQESALEQFKLQKYELNQNFYNELTEKSRQLSSLRHDFKNHLGVIRGRLIHAKYQDAISYLDSLLDYTQTVSELIITNNQTISSILQAKKSECERKEIRFRYEIGFDKIYNITDMDLIIVLGNILDNAIFAASKTFGHMKELNLSIKQVDSYLTIICKNGITERPIEVDGHLISTKKDKTMHGIGLNNVMETCEKYNGQCFYHYDEKEFTINILLPNY